MSVQFYKILSGVFLAHVILISFVWVGFSVPGPRPPATFIYEGALPSEDGGSNREEVWENDRLSDQFAVDRLEASSSKHWIKLRDPSR